MNNRFKFRVWDGDKKKYEYFELHNITVPDRLFCQHKYPVQQFTGLYDKNKKPIYEGDIIRGLCDVGPAGEIIQTATVYWNDLNGYQWNYWNLDTVEIIGNIFQNSKLLKK